MEPEGDAGPFEDRRTQQVDNAIRAIQEKKARPEIDFTIHTMEDNTQVSTVERVCKGMVDVNYPTNAKEDLSLYGLASLAVVCPRRREASQPFGIVEEQSFLEKRSVANFLYDSRCSGTGYFDSDR